MVTVRPTQATGPQLASRGEDAAVEGRSIEVIVVEQGEAEFRLGGGAIPLTKALYDEIEVRGIYDMIEGIKAEVGSTDRIKKLHIFGHGNEDGMNIGKTWLTNRSVKWYAQDLAELAPLFTPDATVVLHGCQVGGAHDLIRKLTEVFGTRVQAGTWYQLPTKFIIGPKSVCELEGDGGIICNFK